MCVEHKKFRVSRFEPVEFKESDFLLFRKTGLTPGVTFKDIDSKLIGSTRTKHFHNTNNDCTLKIWREKF